MDDPFDDVLADLNMAQRRAKALLGIAAITNAWRNVGVEYPVYIPPDAEAHVLESILAGMNMPPGVH